MAHQQHRRAMILVLGFLLIFLSSMITSKQQDELIVTDHVRGKRAVLVTNSDPRLPCRYYGHRYPIRQIVETNPQGVVTFVRNVNPAEWARVSAECQRRANAFLTMTGTRGTTVASVVSGSIDGSIMKKPVKTGMANGDLSSSAPVGLTSGSAKQQFNIIYPGTKWCGPGDVAEHIDDLGIRSSTDRCCRDHDQCPDTMAPGSCKHGICNETPYSKSHCDCDEKFRRCLTESTDSAGLSVGFIYFDLATVSCFRQNSSRCENKKRNDDGLPWCFETPQPFKKEVLGQQQQKQFEISRSSASAAGHVHGVMLKHILTTAVDAKSAVKGAALSSLSGGAQRLKGGG